MQSLGDDAFEVSVSDTAEAQALAKVLREQGGFINVVAGLASVAVQFDSITCTREAAIAAVKQAEATAVTNPRATGHEVRIVVSYGGDAGPDLGQVCDVLDLSVTEFIAKHTAHRHTVELLGFIPGFAYLSSLGARYSVPRLASPRRHVTAGSIGFVEGRSGLYALPGPGGWPLIGQTEAVLFDATAAHPFVLQPGTRVRFVANA